MQTLYITHPACRLHDMGNWHPECPGRLDAIQDQLIAQGVLELLAEREAEPAQMADALRVHGQNYLHLLDTLSPGQGTVAIDGDTLMCPDTWPAMWAAAGAGITAVDAIMRGEAETAFCAVRPPGHHARPEQAMGFCFLNNIAITVAYTLEKYGLERIAIIDFDVHHGNGTAEMFAENNSVLMCGFFQENIFPGVYTQNNAQNTINLPLPAGAGGERVRQLVQQHWLPRLEAFQPQLVVVSAGFDAHRDDDMAQLDLTDADYGWLTDQIMQVAGRHASGRVVSLLEGGYDLPSLGRCVALHIKKLANL